MSMIIPAADRGFVFIFDKRERICLPMNMIEAESKRIIAERNMATVDKMKIIHSDSSNFES